jgi:coproporphyrinogen III oxidase
MNPSIKKKKELELFLLTLREEIITTFESLEPKERFKKTSWQYQKGVGGGEIALLRGEIFEKAAVNWSSVQGKEFPGEEAQGPFSAMGISLITHMMNPHAPTVHFNLRYIETKERFWFGGGYDLTPMGCIYSEDTEHFHRIAQQSIFPFGNQLYSQFAHNAKSYFFLPHRQKERGVGGIFFDHYHSGNLSQDIALWKSIGSHFLDAILPIYKRRIALPYTEEMKETQLRLRAHYVEFNLLYDRGTRFGFRSGGNPDAILCSMPPMAKW